MFIALTYPNLEIGKKILPGRIEISNLNIPSPLIYRLIKKFKFQDLNDLLNKTKKIKFNIKDDFVVRCYKINNNLSSKLIEKKVGEIIFNQNNKVNLKSKNIIIVDIIANNCLIGSKLESKRAFYRIKINNQSLTPLLAYSLIKLAKLKTTETLLDPFCKDSVIPIEASLLKIKNIYAIDSNKNNIRNSKINAKLAKANINFQNEKISWLDTLFKKGEIDKIITFPPYESKRNKKESIEPIIKELFHQSSFILKKTLTIIAPKKDLIEKYSKLYNFKKIKEITIQIGSQMYFIVIFKKQAK